MLLVFSNVGQHSTVVSIPHPCGQRGPLQVLQSAAGLLHRLHFLLLHHHPRRPVGILRQLDEHHRLLLSGLCDDGCGQKEKSLYPRKSVRMDSVLSGGRGSPRNSPPTGHLHALGCACLLWWKGQPSVHNGGVCFAIPIATGSRERKWRQTPVCSVSSREE